MEEFFGNLFIAIVLIVVVVFAFIGFYGILGGFDENYMNGQVDALTGKIKYHLVAYPDSTKGWELIEKD